MQRRKIKNLGYFTQEITGKKVGTISRASFSEYLHQFPSKVPATQRSEVQPTHGLTASSTALQHTRAASNFPHFGGILGKDLFASVHPWELLSPSHVKAPRDGWKRQPKLSCSITHGSPDSLGQRRSVLQEETRHSVAQHLKRAKGPLLPGDRPPSAVPKLTSSGAGVCRGCFPLQASRVLL